jgi:two-component system chemotaxis response regulator CheB
MVPASLTAPRPLEAVVIGGSAGAISALGQLLPSLPAGFPPVLVVVHIPASSPSLLVDVFAPRCAMRVCEAAPGEPIARGSVYFAPADYHLLVEPDRRCALSIDPPVHFSRPSIDVLFESAARAYGAGLAGVVLSGASRDGEAGLRAVHAAGGLAFVQEPGEAETAEMPKAALAGVPDARVLCLANMLAALRALGPAS